MREQKSARSRAGVTGSFCRTVEKETCDDIAECVALNAVRAVPARRDEALDLLALPLESSRVDVLVLELREPLAGEAVHAVARGLRGTR
eukprot:7386173-Prymnesium_polylepis.1